MVTPRKPMTTTVEMITRPQLLSASILGRSLWRNPPLHDVNLAVGAIEVAGLDVLDPIRRTIALAGFLIRQNAILLLERREIETTVAARHFIRAITHGAIKELARPASIRLRTASDRQGDFACHRRHPFGLNRSATRPQ